MLKKDIRKISTVLLTSMVLSFGSTSFADKVQDLKKEQDGIKNEIKTTQEKIKRAQSESKSVEDQIGDLDRKMNKASIELAKVEDELELIQKNIEKNLKELKEAEQKLIEKQENFEARIKVMYVNGNVSYLELLLTSKDIQDFFSRKDMVQAIAEQDKELLEEMREQKDIIEEKKIELEAQRASLSAAKTKLESRKKDLQTATREKENLMSRLQEDIGEFEKEYDKLNDYAISIKGKILQLQEEQRAREEAKRREEEAKKQAASNSSPSSGSSPGSSSSSSSSSQSYTGGTMAWPVPSSGRISSYYGYRIHPVLHTQKLHTGIDIAAPAGSNVVAASSGTVIYSGWLGSYGIAVMVDHGGGIVTLYAHNSSSSVSVGQSVERGTGIAKVGSTGRSTGPHSHFEVRKNGDFVDPLPWIKGN
ncbi:murein hydrolase activator EnvC family protein [Tissierella creatinophila]|uniref:Murein hydrolase activator EnvC n=1 Tax=Tissierella creatinophila DSM 6911 TaxID=1123403 RepID=A0A1U7M759_TISCR|nr:peptidoglycan DD-metalloendopeptidase family protein [Tissierella creatinophila]OLS03049.1 murein hydrolase activator EnvC precursor [Tissierella creatinophila DSM 6911]